MASPARSGFPARTNSRLDAFLRRHLAPEVYDAVRAYEPCIVVSDAEKHTFKYVVLSDRLIYLTENPPKSIRRVVALRDVVAIDLELEQSEKELRTRRENVPEAKLEIYAGITEGHGKFEFTSWIAEIKECKRFNILKEIAISGLFWPNQRLNIVMSYYYCRQ